jgi:hypothetical protein
VSEIAVDDTLFGDVLTPRVQQIIRLEKEADDAQWEAARLISEELAEGKSQRQLAREIGKSQPHVLYMHRCWRLRDNYSYHSSFSEVYNSPEIRAAGEKPDPAPEPEPLPLGEPEVSAPEPAPAANPPAGRQPNDDGAQDLDDGTSEDPEPPAPPAPPKPSDAAERLDRLRQMADEAERDDPEEPLAALLDAQRALRELIWKTRPFRAAGLEVNAALVGRIDALYQEWRGLL